MSIQLKLNNSGAWKTIPHDIDPDDLEAVRAAVLELLACDRHAGGRTAGACWEIDRESLDHPCGERLWVTQGAGRDAAWVQVRL